MQIHRGPAIPGPPAIPVAPSIPASPDNPVTPATPSTVDERDADGNARELVGPNIIDSTRSIRAEFNWPTVVAPTAE